MRVYTDSEKKALLRAAKRLRGQGWKWGTIAKELGCERDTIRRHLDSEYDFARRARRHAYNAKLRAERRDGVGSRGPVSNLITNEDAEALLKRKPPDTRTITGWLMGDPLPGRSALDMERSR